MISWSKGHLSGLVVATLIIVCMLGILTSCDDSYLRGSVTPSKDGKTYLAVADDNGGKCGTILVDGERWGYEINENGIISPGIHTIKCGTEIQFEIPAGVIFRFDYWGP
ncbi:MAG: hypothetical protein ABIJ50_14090 [Pseudomonadota bacterium]